MSKVRIEDTAINSAEVQDVTAINYMISRATALPKPRRAVAAKGADRPALTWACVVVFG